MSPDNRHHRGAHPEDKLLFSEEQVKKQRTALFELCWLLNHGYSPNASLTLVGNHHCLNKRQRLSLARSACTDEQKNNRQLKCIPVNELGGKKLVADGFNLIITLEAALSNAVIIAGRDGCFRDLSGIHGSYRMVQETEKAILLLGEELAKIKPASVLWYLDKPVSNSGRMAAKIRNLAESNHWSWRVEVDNNPDHLIINSGMIALTSDSTILDRTERWSNINALIINQRIPDLWLVDFTDPGTVSFMDGLL